MRAFEIATVVYFVYLLVLAWTFRLPPRARWRVTASALLVGALISTLLIVDSPSARLLRDWLPLLYVLLGYWSSGIFFIAPMHDFEMRLASIDRRVLSAPQLPRRLERAPRALLEYLEATYFATPVFLPAGLTALLITGRPDLVDRYWTTVILAEFGAFGMLPWVQTRPPWELEPPGTMDRRRLTWREINRQVTRPFTIRVNTFPSGHASGTLAVALAVIPAAPVAGAVLLVLALSVSVASVVGRYHYSADVLAGIGVAVLAVGLTRAFGR